MSKRVFAFDLGKASIGYCVRENLEIKELGSIIIDKDHAECTSNKERRRIHKTILAHQAREKFFNEIWAHKNLNILSKEDPKFKKEFPNKNETVIYNSTLLRIALLQDIKLEQWQIYKALHAAIQRRGYDTQLAWANTKSKDDEKNEEFTSRYTKENGVELISNAQYKYPCYYDAARLGLWNEENPTEFKKHVPIQGVIKIRNAGLVAPRQMVENELKLLWKKAQEQLPVLIDIAVEYFLYGEFKEAYGSYKNPSFHEYRGTEKDWQGVLGQKIPRFDNRIIMKCKLLSNRNVCNADNLDNIIFTLLMKLKNLKYINREGEKGIKLTLEEINAIYNNKLPIWKNGIKLIKEGKKTIFTITKTDVNKVLDKNVILEMETFKANTSGRSSFCRRACKIMNKIILEGIENPATMDIGEFLDNIDAPNGITEKEIRTMLSKIGRWENLYIPDNRMDMLALSSEEREKTDLLICHITNPIIRNRLQIFRDLILKLKHAHGEPSEVIFEFIREGKDKSLLSSKKATDAEKYMKQQETYNLEIVGKLKAAEAYSNSNFDKLKLLEMQDSKCIYSGKSIGITDFDKCEIDHIYPRSMGGNDALYNKVLCYAMENQEKAGKTPYEWLSRDEEIWGIYIHRLKTIKSKLGKKKFELLINKPEDCAALIDSYNGLAETAQIAKVAQSIAAFIFGWGLQVEGQNRKIFVNNGASTAAIRKRYGLNRLLGDDVKKNRKNDKHHALDAICISFSREFKYNPEKKTDIIEGFTHKLVEKELKNLIPYPYACKKQLKGNTRPQETVYGKRTQNDKTYLTQRINITSIGQKSKDINDILDETIKNHLLEKLEEKMTAGEWLTMLTNYIHPKKRTHVKKVLTIKSKGKLEKDNNGRERMGEYVDFGNKGVKGQFKCSKGHKGQILYYDKKDNVKVMPIYSNIKNQATKDKLTGCKLYNDGQIFYSGSLIEILNDLEIKNVKYEKGIYKLRTIMSNSQIKIENSDGVEIDTNANTLAKANFKKYDN